MASQTRIGRWISGRQRIAASSLSFSLICHLLVLQLPRGVVFPALAEFSLEFRSFALLSFAASAAAFCIDSYSVFLPVHAVRALFVFIAVRILDAADARMELLLLLPFLADSVLYLGIRGGTATNGLMILATVASDLFSLSRRPDGVPWPHAAFLTTVLAAAAGFLAALIHFRERMVSDGRRLQSLSAALSNLSDANKAYQLYADGVESRSALKERNRITRELHDSVGYALTNVIMSMNAGKVLIREDPARAEGMLEEARRQSEEALRETRRILRELRAIEDPPPEGLRALSRLTRIFQLATGVKVALNYGNIPFSFGKRIDEAIYRLVQEGLTNAFRHGKACEIRVNLWQTDTEIRTTVWNNGRSAAAITDGIGLSGMKERFLELGGHVQPRNAVDGFVLSAVIPYRSCLDDG